MALQPFQWKDRPALIEHLFPVQKISAESFKEQMAGSGKTLTTLGSYWKGRKPLILNKACIIGALLPVTDDLLKDLEIFELIMGIASSSLRIRLKENLPASKHDSVNGYLEKPYNEQVRSAKRPEEVGNSLFAGIWPKVNAHLGTSANSIEELVEQIGVARFGHRPKVADVFSGSGQIPFEAARIGCDVYASDLNPIACMLTWGDFNIVGAPTEKRSKLESIQKKLAFEVEQEIERLGIESDGSGWRGKVYLYCNEVICPESGWRVPLLPSLIISNGFKVIAKLKPIPTQKRYDIDICYVDQEEVDAAKIGTVQDGDLVHSPDGINVYRTSIKSIRGDYREGNQNKNKLRLWERSDFIPRPADIFQERLYCVQWMKQRPNAKTFDYVFRSVTQEDLQRELLVIEHVKSRLSNWQDAGFIPDMLIEKGYNTDQPIRERGWTYWHHLFNPRQLLTIALVRQKLVAETAFVLTSLVDNNSRLCRWNNSASKGAGGNTSNTFDSQALNTLYNYGTRSFANMKNFFSPQYKSFPISGFGNVKNHQAKEINVVNDIYVTDPPYGDAVKYEEVTEFFIAWLRKNPPKEFADWSWDSRRSLAIKGEDEGFRNGMIGTYRSMAAHMPDNGIQILMFTHQSGSIWADMANIIWASGLQVTAAWYVVTETDAAIQDGAHVKGTIILVLRKRHKTLETFRDDLGWEIEQAVKSQVESLVGLDQRVRSLGTERLYTDADLQMAGYAAALKVLTAYSNIDGKDMVREAEAPRQKGRKTFVDELIDFAVQTAVQFLVPAGFEKSEWQKLKGIERFYLKMVDMEHQGAKSLDNYQNFAKALKVHNFDVLMSDASKANSARLKISSELKSSLMAGEAEIAGTPLRALLYALFELSKETEIEEVLAHLMDNCPNYLANKNLLVKMAEYIATKRESLKSTKTFTPEKEASCARVLAEAIRNQRL